MLHVTLPAPSPGAMWRGRDAAPVIDACLHSTDRLVNASEIESALKYGVVFADRGLFLRARLDDATMLMSIRPIDGTPACVEMPFDDLTQLLEATESGSTVPYLTDLADQLRLVWESSATRIRRITR